MGAKTSIQWCDATWTVIKGCDYVSPGCANCYAAGLIHRHSRNPNPKISLPLVGLTNERGRWTGKVSLNEPHLADPLKWKKPRRIFVPSHGDLFHADVPDEFIRRVFAVMSLCGQHTFQVLTKRPERMRAFFADDEANNLSACQAELTARRDWCAAKQDRTPTGRSRVRDLSAINGTSGPRVGEGNYWPLPSVWLGVSVEHQAAADDRVPHLLATPAAVRFLSCEPLLGPVDLGWWLRVGTSHHLSMSVEGALRNKDFVGFTRGDGREMTRGEAKAELERLRAAGVKLVRIGECEGWCPQTGCPGHKTPGIDWVIVGGESGPGARPMHPAWARSLRDQCQAAGVSYFFKQWGEYFPAGMYDLDTGLPRLTGHPEVHVGPAGQVVRSISPYEHGCPTCTPPGYVSMVRVGKKAAGRLLDGREWSEFPEVTRC